MLENQVLKLNTAIVFMGLIVLHIIRTITPNQIKISYFYACKFRMTQTVQTEKVTFKLLNKISKKLRFQANADFSS